VEADESIRRASERGGKRVSFEEGLRRNGKRVGDADERTPLLLSNAQASPPFASNGSPIVDPELDSHWYNRFGSRLATFTKPVRELKFSDVRKRVTMEEVKSKVVDVGKGTMKSIPAVLLGCLLNVLDGVSCKLTTRSTMLRMLT
jgi:hypothetical protein